MVGRMDGAILATIQKVKSLPRRHQPPLSSEGIFSRILMMGRRPLGGGQRAQSPVHPLLEETRL